jgi:hypothetical protein
MKQTESFETATASEVRDFFRKNNLSRKTYKQMVKAKKVPSYFPRIAPTLKHPWSWFTGNTVGKLSPAYMLAHRSVKAYKKAK